MWLFRTFVERHKNGTSFFDYVEPGPLVWFLPCDWNPWCVRPWYEPYVEAFVHLLMLSFLSYCLYRVCLFIFWIVRRILFSIWGCASYIFKKYPVRIRVFHDSMMDRVVIPESAREGSSEAKLTIPKFQVLVGSYKDGEFVTAGNATCLNGYLIVNDHVLGLQEDVYLMGALRKPVKFNIDKFLFLQTDLLAVELPPAVQSQVGAKTAVIHHSVPDTGVFASIVGARGLGTTGVLRNDPVLFGRVLYDGTTKAGYSGAAYCVGDKIVGMHQAGGTVNCGWSASYVWALLKSAAKIVEEDTEDWLDKEFSRGAKIRIDRGFLDPDEVRIQVNGRYANVSRAAFYSVFDKDYEEVGGWIVSKGKRRLYNDGLPSKDNRSKRKNFDLEAADVCVPVPSGEASLTQKNLPASGSLVKSGDQEKANLLRLINALKNSSNKNLLEIMEKGNSTS
uniref:Serine protease n=1 Tax=Riboviria sp. TaxID=2585031 RepID=A0A8K1U433_9VIRU|nr:MAG: hypothetical protein 2 [Riboviria sp.]